MKTGYYYVYILTNDRDQRFYVGVTNDLKRRMYEHVNGINEGFTRKYSIHKLVYYEYGSDPAAAIAREKQLKNWRREKKIALIESMNPYWKDLGEDL